MLTQLDLLTSDAFYSDGILQLLRRDEFACTPIRGASVEVVEVLERHRTSSRRWPWVMATDGVQVIIGGENSAEEAEGHERRRRALRYAGAPGWAGGHCWANCACSTGAPLPWCAI